MLVEVKYGVTVLHMQTWYDVSENEYFIYSLKYRHLKLKLGVVIVSKERDQEKN